MKDENTIQQEIQIHARFYDCFLMRNNSGAFIDTTGRPIRYGLGNISKKHNDNIKSSDLIGITKIVITQEMVGKTIGVFTAVEVKKEDWNCDKKLDKHETAQNNFLSFVKSCGGFAGFANTLESLVLILRR